MMRAGLVLAAALLVLFGTLNAALAYTLSGTVNGGSNPLASAVVTAYSAADQSVAGTSTTDTSGKYSITVANGTYNLLIAPSVASGLANSVVNGIVVNNANSVQNVVLVQQAVVLSGVVRNPAGVGMKNIQVSVKDQASDVVAGTVFTDANGNYSVPLASGTYKIDVQGGSTDFYGYCGPNGAAALCSTNVPAPSNFSSWSGALVNNLAITSTTVKDIIIPFVTLSGKTTDGKGVAVGNVIVKQTGSQYKTVGYYYISNNSDTNPIKSDALGNYSLTLIAGTGYSVTLVPPAASGLAQTVVNAIDVTADTLRNFALQPAITLSGVVRNPTGVGMKNIEVSVKDQASDVVAGTVFSDANGNYSVPLASGTYKIDVQGGSTDFYGYCGPNGAAALCSTNVPAPSNFSSWSGALVNNLAITSTTVKDIIIPFVTLSGKTTDGNGVAVGNVIVKQTGSQYKTVGYYYISNNSDTNPIKSDALGNYSLTLIAGTGYSITIIPPTNSGFAQTVVNDIDATTNISQNIILSLNDTTAPVILSGPRANSVKDTTASIEWQTNEPAKGGVQYGTSNPPVTALNEKALATSHSVSLTGLAPATTYYVSVNATDASGNGPTTSQVVTFTTTATPDTTPPVILTGPTVSSITNTSALVAWSSNESSTGAVQYGLTNTLGQSANDTTLTASHQITLTNLTANTLYYLKTTATDGAGNGPTSSAITSFSTLAVADSSPPVIVEGPMVISISDTAATVVWKTDEPATSGVSWNDGTAYGVLSDPAASTSHSVRLTGLTANTQYHFIASSKDVAGNGPTLSGDASFRTMPTADKTPPVFTVAPAASSFTQQTAVISWETDEPADSVIDYGTTQSLGHLDSQASLITKHNRTLTGLLPGATYYFRVQSTDSNGNGPSSSAVGNFTTSSVPDTTAPVITLLPAAIYLSNTRATVYFETDEVCDTLINYGIGATLTNQASSADKVTKHQINLTNLTAAKSYSFKASCADLAGNSVTSTTLTFSTASSADSTAPVIGSAPAPSAGAITGSSALISWTTNEISDSRVSYGVQGQSLPLTAGDTVQVKNHAITLSKLSPNTVYEYKVASLDPSNNGPTSSAVLTFSTTASDNTAPQVDSFNVPASSATLTVAITLAASDGVGVTGFCVTEAATASGCSWTGAVPASYTFGSFGAKTLYAFAKDAAGNISTSVSRSIVVDGDLPTLTISSITPAGGSVTNASSITVAGTAIDLTSGIQSLKVNGTSVALAPDGSFSTTLTLVSGSNSINTVATDKAGNQRSDARSVTYDPNAPPLNISSPADNLITTRGTLSVSGTVGAGVTVSIAVDGRSYTPAVVSGTFQQQITLTTPKTYSIAVTASSSGKSVTLQRSVTLIASSTIAQIAAGEFHSVLIKTDGSLYSWGDNGFGQLGNGTRNNLTSPARVGSDTDWSYAAAGRNQTLAIKSDGTLWGWGHNNSGQLGDGSTVDKSAPIKIGSEADWVQVSSGNWHTLAVKRDGSLWAWGYNGLGDLGDGSTTSSYAPERIGSSTNWQQVSAGGCSTALSSDGALWSWGNNDQGQLGDGSNIAKTSPARIGSASDWKLVASGGSHAMALKDDGSLWGWGNNAYGQLGDGTTANRPVPTRIGNSNDWQLVAAGLYNSVALKTDQTLFAWGDNSYGQLGDGTALASLAPKQVGTVQGSVQAASGGSYTIALTADGYLRSWGSNASGQLGDGSSARKTQPTRIGADANWKQIAVSGMRVDGIRSDGTLWAWGDNASGALGDATRNNKETPVQIGSATTWNKVASGSATLAVRGDGTLWGWGSDNNGQLGDGSYADKTSPVQIGSASDWSQVASGSVHTLAIKNDGSLWAWGDNSAGQLGDGSNSDKNIPTRIGVGSDWAQVGANSLYSMAIKTDGTLWSWGDNSSGQLGDGTTTGKNTPTRVGSDGTWQTVAAGLAHLVALKTDGSLWAWGDNSRSQLGDNSTTARLVPTRIGSTTDWKQVGANGYHSIATKNDGSLWGWGDNSYGQLGDGSSTNKPQPVRIGAATDWKQVGAGTYFSAALKSDGSLWAWGDNSSGQLGDGSAWTSTPEQILAGVANSDLTITSAGSGAGTVTASSGSVAWSGSTGVATYVTGTSVTLTPAASATSIFTGWSGACSGSDSCTVAMTVARSVTATFLPKTTLTVNRKGTGIGKITSAPSGINCNAASCSAGFSTGTGVTLTALPDPSSTFLVWGNGCDSSSGNSCTMTLSGSAKSVDVYFAPLVPVALSLTLSSNHLPPGGSVDFSGSLTPMATSTAYDLSNLALWIDMLAPDGSSSSKPVVTGDSQGHFTLAGISGLTQKGTYKVSARFAGNDNYAPATSSSQSLWVDKLAGYAIIVQGKEPDNEGLADHRNTTDAVYNSLLQQGFLDTDITYLQSGPTSVPLKSDVQNAIDTWAKNKLNAFPAPLYIFMVDHGTKDGFVLGGDTITPADLKSWLDTLEAGLTTAALAEKRIVTIGTCYSGMFIPALSKQGRAIIASAGPGEVSVRGGNMPGSTGLIGEKFVDELIKTWSRQDLQGAFKAASKTVNDYAKKQNNVEQHPLLDDDGNTVGHFDLDGSGDGDLVAGVKLTDSVAVNSSTLPADIYQVTPTVQLSASETQKDLWLAANNNSAVSTAWVEINRPDTVSTSGGGGQIITNTAIKLMSYNSATDRWEITYASFDLPGSYQFFYYTRDRFGNVSPMASSTVYKQKAGNSAPASFQLLSPADNSTGSTVNYFLWSPSTDTDGVTYTFLLSKNDPTFSPANVTKVEGITDTFLLADTDQLHLDNAATYSWKIQAIDRYGAITESGVWTFATNNTNGLPAIIMGYLVDASSGAAIAGATVVTDAGNAVTTLANGMFFTFHPTGSYALTVSAAGYSKATAKGSASAGKVIRTDLKLAQANGPTKPGDCDNSGTVTIAEVQSAINMYLGLKPVTTCVDTDQNGIVSIAEVQKVINSFLGL
jgi:alpha-tubulin suppressor-like RCC1 family protein/ribosomal protein L27